MNDLESEPLGELLDQLERMIEYVSDKDLQYDLELCAVAQELINRGISERTLDPFIDALEEAANLRETILRKIEILEPE